MGASGSVPQKSIHEFKVKNSKGKDVDLGMYKGKVLLVVNIASRCGFTDSNYTQLTELYQRNKDKDPSGTGNKQGQEVKGRSCKLDSMGEILRIILRDGGSSHACHYRVHVQESKSSGIPTGPFFHMI